MATEIKDERRVFLSTLSAGPAERRLALIVGPASAGYAARLREALYAAGRHRPPSPAERRAVRRELTSGLGLRARLRALLAMPPGGPADIRG